MGKKIYKFSEILKFSKKSHRKAGDGLNDGKYQFFTSSQIQRKWLNEADYKEESVILGTGGLPSVHIAQNFSTSADTFIFTPSNKDISLRYIYYFLSGNIDLLAKGFKGAGLKHLSKQYVEEILIPIPLNEKGLPDIIEQERITELLEEAEIIKNKRSLANIAITKLVPSLFFGIFGDPGFNEHNWPIVKLKDIAQIKIGPFGSLLHQNEYIKGGIPLVNPSHIIDGKIAADLDLTIGKSKAESLSGYRMKVGDIVLGRRGEMGRCAIVTKNEEGFLCGTGSIFITPLEGLSSLFLHTLLSSSQMKLILEGIAKGVTMKNLNSSNLEELKIYLPPIELQKKFAFLIEEIEAQKNKQKESTQKVDELFNAVMAKSFA